MDIAPLSLIRFIDTETTGFNPPGAEICEIGWTELRLFPDGWKIELDQQSAFVDPGHPIPNSHIHGITDEMVVGAMTPLEARTKLIRGADILAAHNVQFDRRFVRSDLPWICTLECSRYIFTRAPNHKNETLKEYLGIRVDGDAHRAGYDAAVSARILLKLFEHMTLEEMLEKSRPDNVPLRMPFGKHRGEKISDLPDSYLRWLVTESDVNRGVKTAAKAALGSRGA